MKIIIFIKKYVKYLSNNMIRIINNIILLIITVSKPLQNNIFYKSQIFE